MSGDATRGPRGLTGRPICFQVRLGPQFPSLLFLAKKQKFLEVLDAQASEVSNSVSLSCSDRRGVCDVPATKDEKAGSWWLLSSQAPLGVCLSCIAYPMRGCVQASRAGAHAVSGYAVPRCASVCYACPSYSNVALARIHHFLRLCLQWRFIYRFRCSRREHIYTRFGGSPLLQHCYSRMCTKAVGEVDDVIDANATDLFLMFAHMTTSPNPACVCVQGVDEQRPLPTVAHSLQALGALSSEQEFEELRQCALLPVRTCSLVLVLHDPSQGGVHFSSHE